MTILSLSAFFLLGVLLADRSGVPVAALVLFLVASLMAFALLTSVRRFPFLAVLPAALLLGMLRVEASGVDQGSLLADYHGWLPLQVEGVVASDPEGAGVATRFLVRAERINTSGVWTDVSGDVLVTALESRELVSERVRPYYRYGDRLVLHGTLEPPPELKGFDYPAYLARQGIGSVMSFPEAALIGEGEGLVFYRWLYGVRRRLAQSLAAAVPEPQASLGQALLLGMRDTLPEDLVEDFRDTGTSHVLAISGLHVSILLAVSLAVSRWVFGQRRQLYLLLPLCLMWLYALISGMSPSVARASMMGTVYLAALLVGRPRSVLPALGLAAALMVAVDPQVVGRVSFQLSFAAMAGIALFSEPLGRRFQALLSPPFAAGGGFPSPVRTAADIVTLTIAATVATLPLVAFHFQQVSLVGLPATVLILPALPAVLLTQVAAGLVGLASVGASEVLGWGAWLAARYVIGVVELAARLPGASVETGPLSPYMVWAYYVVLALLYLGAKVYHSSRRWLADAVHAFSSTPILADGVSWWVLAPIISIAALLWIAALSLPDGRLRVTMIDIGQGDAAFITTPGGQQILVDGGLDPFEVVRFLGEKMPFWDRSIDLVVLTHPHSDHVNGLTEVLRRYDVGLILERESKYESPSYDAWRRAVAAEDAETIEARAGQVIALRGGVIMEVVNPPERLLRGTSSDVDNASVALRLVHGAVSFLLTGDMFDEAEGALVRRNFPIDSDVLKVAHHGSRSSSSPAFLDRVSPAVAVTSAGEGNRYGHPHAETLEALRRRLPEGGLLSTLDNGNIEFISDGNRLEVKTER